MAVKIGAAVALLENAYWRKRPVYIIEPDSDLIPSIAPDAMGWVLRAANRPKDQLAAQLRHNGRMKLTRRAWTNVAAAAAASLVMVPTAKTQVAVSPPEAALNNARAQVQASSRDLAAVKLPRAVEPATRFEA